jgi:hypothetical protein
MRVEERHHHGPRRFELRLGKLRRRLAEDLVRAAQLAILSLQDFQPLLLVSREARVLAAVSLGLADPQAQTVPRHTHSCWRWT